MTWQAVELANGKPPYQWKHGWIPLTPDATAIKAKKKRGSARDTPSRPRPMLRTGQVPSAGYQVRPKPKPKLPSRASAAQQESVRAKNKEFETEDPKIRAEFKQLAKENQTKLGYEDQDVVTWYVADSGPMNVYKRTGEEETDEIGEQADRLSAAIQRHKLKKPTTVFRGFVANKNSMLLPGDVISDDGFSSTSYDPAVARYFSEFAGNHDKLKSVVLEIDLPAGTSALVVNTNGLDLDYEQSELILDSGQPFRILEVSDDGEYVRAEAIVSGR
jgi:hypothetical protein